jgi:hypothetical protein
MFSIEMGKDFSIFSKWNANEKKKTFQSCLWLYTSWLADWLVSLKTTKKMYLMLEKFQKKKQLRLLLFSKPSIKIC